MAGVIIAPDTKDWTWVLERPCPECGFDPAGVPTAVIGERVRRNAALWGPLLADDTAVRHAEPGAWSTLEYAAHVRDVHRVFGARLALMLERDDPLFDDWDQDAAAREGRYAEQDPHVVAAELADAADRTAAAYDAVPDEAWVRAGRRSNGSAFTVETLGRYQLHDLEHHAWDVRAATAALTVRAYDDRAADYRLATEATNAEMVQRVDAFATRLGPGSRVLEIGSGGGRDAVLLEERGVRVRRTDVTQAFVDLLREAGHEANRLDPLVDDLADPAGAYDGVWANASLLHVERADLPAVLARVAAVVRPGGVLSVAVKEGDGEAWSTHGSIGAPRRFVFWRADPLAAVVSGAGWSDVTVESAEGHRDERWVLLTAVRSR